MALTPSYSGQYAQCTIKAVAVNTATLSITAVAGSVSTWTYTFSVTQGSIANAVSGGFLYVIVSGMQSSANNGGFATTPTGSSKTITSFTATTMTVTNASGVAESGSTGTGVCPSDSGIGPAVNLSIAGKTGYSFQVGTNSFAGDGRTGYHELWKITNPVGNTLGLDLTTPPSVNDVIAISAENGAVTAWVNSLLYINAGGTPQSFADASYTTGVQGMTAWSFSGPNEYNFNQWSSAGLPANSPGNNGTQAGDFKCGTVTSTQLQTDLVPYANGDLHTANSNWVYNNGSFTVLTNVIYSSSAAAAPFNIAQRNDISPGADQYSECIMVITAVIATQNGGPALRISGGNYYGLQLGNNASNIILCNSGVVTTIKAFGFGVLTGDLCRMTARGNVLTFWRNGVAVGSVIDNTLASGKVGIWGAGNATANGYSSWAGGNYVWQQTGSDTFAPVGPFGAGWNGPISTTFESMVALTQGSQAIASPDHVSPTASNGGDSISGFNGGTSGGGSNPPGSGDLGPGYDFKFRL
jgi:hypothetical protein